MIAPRHLLPAAVLALAACATIKKYTPTIPLPGLPDLTSVKRILPGSDDKVNDQDPTVAFEPRSILRPGHTLRLDVHEGLRSGKSLWAGLTVVEMDGTITLGKIGSTQVRGQRLPEVAQSIGALFRIAGYTASPVAVHILSVENTPLIAVEGDLAAGPQPLPLFDGATVQEAVRLVGGRRPASTARGVYIAREGRQRFFRSIEAADTQWRLAPGDIITLSPDV
jgi:protein involved in polysaccharide export with SLBB domain